MCHIYIPDSQKKYCNGENGYPYNQHLSGYLYLFAAFFTAAFFGTSVMTAVMVVMMMLTAVAFVGIHLIFIHFSSSFIGTRAFQAEFPQFYYQI